MKATRKDTSTKGSKKPAARPIKFAAMLTKKQVKQSEETERVNAVHRRIGLYVLTSSSKQLVSSCRDVKTATAFMEVADNIEHYLDWRKKEAELLSAAQARIFAAVLRAHPELAKGGAA